MNNYDVGRKIYENRVKLDLSQNDLANMLGVTNKAVSKWENGNAYPSTEIIIKLSNIFGVTIDYLLKEELKKKKIHRIVITGGPCAGKSTALSWIQNKFVKDGYDIVFVPETATELIKSGITPFNTNGNINFQKQLMKLQIEKEKIYEESIQYLPSDKVLIIYDRGLLDAKAYIEDKEFNLLLNSEKQDEVKLRDKYDAVFHLVTAADGAKDFYTLDNNEARYESIEEAIDTDRRIQQSWTGHPHLRIIENNCTFEEKMKKLIDEISHFVGEPVSYEIERKFLVKMPDLNKIMKIATKSEIIQTYILKEKGEEIRIRQRGFNGSYNYYMTIKKEISDVKRVEIEERLSEREYLSYLMKSNTELRQIRKDRYCFIYKGQYFELDVFPFWNDKAILEIELLNENDKIKLPKFLEVIEEVTENKDYKNYVLAKRKK